MSDAIAATAPAPGLSRSDWVRQIKLLGLAALTVFLISLALAQPAASASCAGTALSTAEIQLPDITRTA